MSHVCKNFCFSNKISDSLIFANSEEIVSYNYIKNKKYPIFDFDDLDEQPELFVFS